LVHKRTFFDGSVRVPLIIRTPETAAAYSGGATSDALCEWFDVGPTLVELAGAAMDHPMKDSPMKDSPVNDGLFARSLCPVLGDPGKSHRQEAISEYRGELMIFDGTRKMAVTGKGRTYLHFDLLQDPLERENLAGEPGLTSVERDLKERLFRHLLRNQIQILNYYR
jgi:arylsulfatase A-like enzyme